MIAEVRGKKKKPLSFFKAALIHFYINSGSNKCDVKGAALQTHSDLSTLQFPSVGLFHLINLVFSCKW